MHWMGKDFLNIVSFVKARIAVNIVLTISHRREIPNNQRRLEMYKVNYTLPKATNPEHNPDRNPVEFRRPC